MPSKRPSFHERVTHSAPGALSKVVEFAWFWGHHGPWRRLRGPQSHPVPASVQERLPPAPDGAVRVTWAGHASAIVQMGGKTLLTDPVWSDALPGGVRRLTPPGVSWDGLPRVDGVLLSHNHYDHLDLPTLRRLPAGTPIFVPHGVGSWLRGRGFGNVTELDWHESVPLDGLTLTLVPAHHWSRRGVRDANRTLWGGWIVRDLRGHQAYFAGDTGYGRFFREIGHRYPDIDVAILPIGAYAPKRYNGGAHMDPAQAVQAFLDLGARNMVPVHWGTFRLSPEPVLEPWQWLQSAWQEAGLPRERLWDLAIGSTRGLGSPAPEVHAPLPSEPSRGIADRIGDLLPTPQPLPSGTPSRAP